MYWLNHKAKTAWLQKKKTNQIEMWWRNTWFHHNGEKKRLSINTITSNVAKMTIYCLSSAGQETVLWKIHGNICKYWSTCQQISAATLIFKWLSSIPRQKRINWTKHHSDNSNPAAGRTSHIIFRSLYDVISFVSLKQERQRIHVT